MDERANQPSTPAGMNQRELTINYLCKNPGETRKVNMTLCIR